MKKEDKLIMTELNFDNQLTIKQLRTFLGMTQLEFSKHVGIKYSTYLKCERHPEKMKAQNLIKISQAVNYPIAKIKIV